MSNVVAPRPNKGQFVKGVSGNPAGRPAGRKNEIVMLKQELEIAVRNHIKPDQVKAIINKMVNRAMNGDVTAAKLILDKVLSNAQTQDDAPDTAGGYKIIIENATFAVQQGKDVPPATVKVVDADYTEVK